ncbi:MAG: hypothetical protein JKY37_23360 [Nannocystaceae bacterium]|nr:hypothetical protein [Nannocystaceae bacterium]
MRITTAAVTFLAVLVGSACGGDGDAGAMSEDSADGKYDDLDDIDESACSLDASVDRNLVQFVNNDHVQFRCRGPSGFVETGCCKPQIEEFTFATGCPLQAKFDKVDDITADGGSRQRCVSDQPDNSENVGVVELVATSCCTLLCDDAKWDDPAVKSRCREANGQFTAHACCEMNDDTGCGDAVWEAQAEDEGLQRCWAQSGEFAGRYATNACCIDQCFRDDPDGTEVQQIDDLPLECLIPTDNECSGATVNDLGACALVLTAEQRTAAGDYLGDWGKAMCCAGSDNLDMELADECHRRELLGGDLSICS